MASAFPVAALMERLGAVSALSLVGNARDLTEALQTPPRSAPAVFVLAETRGGSIKYSGTPVQQGRTTALKLVVWVRHHGDAATSRAEMDRALAAIDARLTGWSPSNPPFGAVVFRGSRDEFAHGQYLVAQVLYECEWNFSAEVQP